MVAEEKDSYKEYNEFEAYGEEDLYGGGEQFASATYVNDALKVNKEEASEEATAAMAAATAAQAAAQDAQQDANTANNKFAELSDDNKLTPVEKKAVLKEWNNIKGEKGTIEAQATFYGIVTEKLAYTTAYNTLETYITPLISALASTADINGTTFRTRFEDYYNAKVVLLKAISDDAKEIADAAATAAAGAQQDANAAQQAAQGAQEAADDAATAASAAQSSANSANNKLADIASDSKLTAAEKKVTKKEWDIIVSEKPVLDAQADIYLLTGEKTTYGNAYTALSTYITPLLTSLTSTSDINGSVFRAYFKDYYDARTTLLKRVSEEAKEMAVLAQQAADDAQAAADAKGNPIKLQPTEPPLNPAVGDMWIDTSIFPHIIYAWDGTQWSRSTVISAEEVGAYTVAQSDEQATQVYLDLSALDERTTIVEQKTDPTSIVDTVTQHQTYILDRDGAVASGIEDLEGKLADEAYLNEKYPSMVTSSVLKREAEAIIGKFAKGGGVNLLENSVGYAGLKRWQLMSGAAEQIVGDEMVDSKSGFTINTGVITQTRGAVIGEEYTLTIRLKKGTAGSAWVKLSDGTNFEQVDFIATQSYDYSIAQITAFTPENPVLIVEFGASGATGGAIFTAAMLNTGEVGYQWSLANGELYNTAVQMDINGLNVKSSVYDGYTVMSPEEFSGYARNNQGVMEKVFTLNKDTTEMTKAQIDDEITLGGIKMVRINGGGYNGISFVRAN